MAIARASVTRLVRMWLGELPADDHAGGQVDHGGQVQPALAGAQVGDVPDQPGPGAGAVKSRPIRSGVSTGSSPGDRRALVGTWLHGAQARAPASGRRPARRCRVSAPVELGSDPPAAVGLRGCSSKTSRPTRPARRRAAVAARAPGCARRRTTSGTPRAARTSRRSGSWPSPRRSARACSFSLRPREEGCGFFQEPTRPSTPTR